MALSDDWGLVNLTQSALNAAVEDLLEGARLGWTDEDQKATVAGWAEVVLLDDFGSTHTPDSAAAESTRVAELLTTSTLAAHDTNVVLHLADGQWLTARQL